MITLPLFALALLAQDPAPAADAAQQPKFPQIQAAVKALQEADNYTFVQTTLEPAMPQMGRGGAPGGGRGGRGAGPGGDAQDPTGGEAAAPPAPEPVVLTGHVQKGQASHFAQGEEQAWRDAAGNVVFLEADGTWKAFEPAAMRGGGRGGRGAGPGGDAADPVNREAMRTQQAAMRARMGMLRVSSAHEILAGLDQKLDSVQKSEKGGMIIYVGTLTPEGAASLAGGGGAMGGGRGGRGGPGGQGGGMEQSGTCTIVLSADGRLESVVLDTLTKGSFGERAIERKRHVEVQISKVGETKLEVPAEVTEALQAAASARSARERGDEAF